MRFLFKKYQAKKKEIIKVEIDTPTKVKFLTAHDFKLYQKGKTHRYYGGSFPAGDVKFVLPFDSVWHAVVERGSYHTPVDISATCSLLAPDRDTLSTIASDAPSSVKNAIERSNDTVNDLLEDAAEGIEDAVDAVVEKGKDILDGE